MKKLITILLAAGIAGSALAQSTYSPAGVKITDGDNNVLSPYSAPSNIVSVANSTTNLLGISGVFTGTAVNMLGHGYVFVNVYSDVASGTHGLSVQQSPDGTNWDNTDEYTVPAATGKTYAFQSANCYLRVVYSNGVSGQAAFRLQTTLQQTGKPSSHSVHDPIIDEDDAELVKAVLTAKQAADGFVNIAASPSGNLMTTDAENGLAIAKGEVTGTTFIHKFGDAPAFATGDGQVTVWDGADSAGLDIMDYTYSATNDIDSVISSSTADVGTLEIQGLDINYNLTNQTITLNGQTRVAIPTPLRRVFRMKNVWTADVAGTLSCYITNSPAPSGVVTDDGAVRAIINNGNNQTLMAIYTIPAGKTGYMRDWYASVSSGNKTSNYEMELKARPFGQVFQLKHRASLSDIGGSYIHHIYHEPEVFTEKTDIEMLVTITATGVTAAGVSAGFDIVLVDN